MSTRAPTPPTPPSRDKMPVPLQMAIEEQIAETGPGGEVILIFKLKIVGTDERFLVTVAGAPDSFASRYMAALRVAEMAIGEAHGGQLLDSSFIPAEPESDSVTSFKVSGTGRVQ